jgi:hypothetical protein
MEQGTVIKSVYSQQSNDRRQLKTDKVLRLKEETKKSVIKKGMIE